MNSPQRWTPDAPRSSATSQANVEWVPADQPQTGKVASPRKWRGSNFSCNAHVRVVGLEKSAGDRCARIGGSVALLAGQEGEAEVPENIIVSDVVDGTFVDLDDEGVDVPEDRNECNRGPPRCRSSWWRWSHRNECNSGPPRRRLRGISPRSVSLSVHRSSRCASSADFGEVGLRQEG